MFILLLCCIGVYPTTWQSAQELEKELAQAAAADRLPLILSLLDRYRYPDLPDQRYLDLALEQAGLTPHDEHGEIPTAVQLQIAYGHTRLKQIPQALNIYESARTKAQSEQDWENVANADEGIGWVHFLVTNDRQLAKVFFQRALDTFQKSDDHFGMARALNGLAAVEETAGKGAEATGYYLRALELCSDSPDDRVLEYQAGLHGSVALIYLNLEQIDDFHAHLAKQEQIYLRLPQSRSKLGLVYAHLGDYHLRGKRYAEARRQYQKAIAAEKDSPRLDRFEAEHLAAIGDSYRFADQLKEAEPYYLQALELIRRVDYAPYLTHILHQTGKYYLHLGQIQKAQSLLEESITICKDKNLHSELCSLYRTMVDLHSQKGEPELAIDYLKHHEDLSRQIHSQPAIVSVVRQLEQNRRTEKNKGSDKPEKNHSLLVTAGVALLLLTLFMVWRWHSRPAPVPMKQEEQSRSSKYATSSQSPDQALACFQRLQEIMERDHLYRNPDLNQAALAEILEINQTYLSQALNVAGGKTFNTFINEYRLSEAKEFLLDPQKQTMTNQEIAKVVGFNSKASFYRLFKQETGLSPSEFKSAL